MTLDQTKYLIDELKKRGVSFEEGLTESEFEILEHRFLFFFPPDFKNFLKQGLPISEGFVNWRKSISSSEYSNEVLSRLNWPLEGMKFDIESNEFWYGQWGVKPDSLVDRNKIAGEHYVKYPTLVPIYSHRYIPSEPLLSGNPVFSVYQMDIIYYGYDLASYLASEFSFDLSKDFELLEKPLRKIEFWSEWT